MYTPCACLTQRPADYTKTQHRAATHASSYTRAVQCIRSSPAKGCQGSTQDLAHTSACAHTGSHTLCCCTPTMRRTAYVFPDNRTQLLQRQQRHIMRAGSVTSCASAMQDTKCWIRHAHCNALTRKGNLPIMLTAAPNHRHKSCLLVLFKSARPALPRQLQHTPTSKQLVAHVTSTT